MVFLGKNLRIVVYRYVYLYRYIIYISLILERSESLKFRFFGGWGFFTTTSANQPMLEKLGVKPYKYKLYCRLWGCRDLMLAWFHNVHTLRIMRIWDIYDCMKIWICVRNISTSNAWKCLLVHLSEDCVDAEWRTYMIFIPTKHGIYKPILSTFHIFWSLIIAVRHFIMKKRGPGRSKHNGPWVPVMWYSKPKMNDSLIKWVLNF